MSITSSEQALIDRFSRTYAHLTGSEAMLEIERAVCGCDYGCTSWTTRDEAEEVIKMLNLDPKKRLLEVGAGSGWPGLYLGKRSGCHIALIDLPPEGLQVAKKRAQADGMAARCWIARADAVSLPFPRRCFDAIYHSDVLCCLIEKQAVLNECRKVIRENGKMVFSVILIAPGLSDEDYQRAATTGPPFVEAPAKYPEMIEAAGWKLTAHADQTANYFETFQKMYAKELANIRELERVHGAEETGELLARRANTLDALERDLLRREVFTVIPANGA